MNRHDVPNTTLQLPDVVSLLELRGVRPEVIQELVTTATLPTPVMAPNGSKQEEQQLSFFSELITLAEASRRHEVNIQTLRTWIHRGHLLVRDRVRDRVSGSGRLHIIVDEIDVLRLISDPPKTGRPRGRK